MTTVLKWLSKPRFNYIYQAFLVAIILLFPFIGWWGGVVAFVGAIISVMIQDRYWLVFGFSTTEGAEDK